MSHIDYDDGEGDLYIVDIGDARTMEKSHIDRVVTVCQDSIEDNVSDDKKYNFFCMSDGASNEYGGDHSYHMFSRAASVVFNSLKQEESVLLHCHMGASRSVSVATAALGRLLDLSRSDAYDLVKYYRPQAKPDQFLMGHASVYIEEHTQHDSLWSEYENDN